MADESKISRVNAHQHCHEYLWPRTWLKPRCAWPRALKSNALRGVTFGKHSKLKKKEDGYILITIFISLTTLLLIIGMITYYRLHTYKIAKATFEGIKSRVDKEIIYTDQSTEDTTLRQLIIKEDLDDSSSFPRIDYNYLLYPLTDCTALLFNDKCIDPVISSKEKLSISSAIVAESQIAIPKCNECTAPFTLSSLDSITIENSLTTKRNIIIVAPYAIKINKIVNPSNEKVIVELISALKDVELKALQGEIALRVIANKRSRIPEGVIYEEKLKTPLLRNYPIGLK